MKKFIPFLSVLFLMSCGELLPDLSPDSPDGLEMVVKEVNYSTTPGPMFPGTYNSETEGFDINDDGIEDFKIKIVTSRANTPFGPSIDNQFAIGVNGQYLGFKPQDFGTCDNPVGYFERNPILLGAKQLVGESNIPCSAWFSNTFDADFSKAGNIRQTGEEVFIAVKIKIDGKMHFGWVKLQIENTGTGFNNQQKITILKVAYATKAGKRIMTGV